MIQSGIECGKLLVGAAFYRDFTESSVPKRDSFAVYFVETLAVDLGHVIFSGALHVDKRYACLNLDAFVGFSAVFGEESDMLPL